MDLQRFSGDPKYAKLRALGIFGVLALGFVLGWLPRDAVTRLDFVSVGQGDCTVFRHAGRTIMIDAGGKSEYVDAGRRVVVPALRELGLQVIDMVLITHPDRDHFGGLEAIAERWKIGSIGMPVHFKGHEQAEEIVSLAEHFRIPVEWISADSSIEFEDATLEFDYAPWGPDDSDNFGSLAVMITVGGGSALIVGDADAESEGILLTTGDWGAQVLQASHHGSRNGSSYPWLLEVDPDYVVVSCGRDNSYGHPADTALARIKATGADLIRTDLAGTVSFGLGEAGFEPLR
jgi:competence protein ComEC